MASSDVIRFDSDYMRDRAKVVSQAGDYVNEAIECLRKANRHEGWQCAERAEINRELGEIKKQLANIKDNAVTPVSTALSCGADQCADLGTRNEAQENQIAEQMRKDWGFKPSLWQRITGTVSGWVSKLTGGDKSSESTLPVTLIPKLPAATSSPAQAAGTASVSSKAPSSTINISDFKPDGAPEIPSGILEWVRKHFSFSS